jgi:hypothetical protein
MCYPFTVLARTNKRKNHMGQPTDMIVFDNASRPSASPSAIRKWADVITGGHATPVLRTAERHVGVGHLAAFLHSIRASGESAMMGGALGIVSGMGGLDRDGVPVDLAAWAGSTALGVAFAHHEVGSTLRTAGHTALGIFSFRKTEEWFGVRKKTVSNIAGDTFQGETIDVGADPIVEAAKNL